MAPEPKSPPFERRFGHRAGPRQAETAYEVVALEGPLHVQRQPGPWSLPEGPAESVKAAIEEMLSP